MPLATSAVGSTDSAVLSLGIAEAVRTARQARAIGTVLPTAAIRPADTIRPGPRPQGAPAAKVETLA